jgi:hypothetical protein
VAPRAETRLRLARLGDKTVPRRADRLTAASSGAHALMILRRLLVWEALADGRGERCQE